MIFCFALFPVQVYEETPWPIRVVRRIKRFHTLARCFIQGGSIVRRPSQPSHSVSRLESSPKRLPRLKEQPAQADPKSRAPLSVTRASSAAFGAAYPGVLCRRK